MPITAEEIKRTADAYRAGEINEGQLRAFYSRVKAEKAAAQRAAPQQPQGVEGAAISPQAEDFINAVRGLGMPAILLKQQLGLGGHDDEEKIGFGEFVKGLAAELPKSLARGAVIGSELASPIPRIPQVRQAIAERPFTSALDVAGLTALSGGLLKGAMRLKKAPAPKVAPTVPDEPVVTKAPPVEGVRGNTLDELKAMREQVESRLIEEQRYPFAKETTKLDRLESDVTALRGLREQVAKGKKTKSQQAQLQQLDERIGHAEQMVNAELNKRIATTVPGRVMEPVPQQPTPPAVQRSLSSQVPIPKGRSLRELIDMGPTIVRAHTPSEVWNAPLVDLTAPYDPVNHSFVRRVGRGVTAPIRAFSRPEKVLARHPVGQAFERLRGSVEDVFRGVESVAIEPIYDAIATLKHSDRVWMMENFRTAYRGGTAMPNERIQFFADTWRRAHEYMADAAGRAGLEFGKQKNFLPDYWTDEAILAFEARNGPIWDAIVEWARKEKGIPEESFKGIVENLVPREGDLPVRKSGSLEFDKKLGLPDEVMVQGRKVRLVDTNPFEVIGKYVKANSRRIGIVEHFGPDDARMRQLLDAAGENPALRKMLKEQWRVVQGIGRAPGFYTSFWGRTVMGLESAARGTHLSGSVIANLTGPMQSFQKFGLKNTLRAQWDIMRTWGGDKWKPQWFRDKQLKAEMARMEASWSRVTLRKMAQAEGLGGAFGISEKVGRGAELALRATGLQLVEQNTNKISGLAAQQYVADIFNRLRNPKTGKLRRLVGADDAAIKRQLKRDFVWSDADINRIIENGLSKNDRIRVGRRASALTNAYAEGSGVRPYWMRHPIAQRALAYTSFVRIRGNMLADAFAELKHGNVKPIARYLGISVLTGEMEIALKGFFKNKERVDKNWLHRLFNDLMAAATFGYLGAAYEEAKYSYADDPIELVGDVVSPPFMAAARDTWDFANDAAKELKRGRVSKYAERAEEYARRVSPGADVLLANLKRVFKPEEAEREKRKAARRTRRRQRRDVLP